MIKIEDKIKELWNNETLRDVTIISGVTVAEYVIENILHREIAPKYQNASRLLADGASNLTSYFLGKSQGEKSASTKQNVQP